MSKCLSVFVYVCMLLCVLLSGSILQTIKLNFLPKNVTIYVYQDLNKNELKKMINKLESYNFLKTRPISIILGEMA